MEYTVNKDFLPIYYQQGYIEMKNGISVGERVPLPQDPISALYYHQCIELGICCEGSGESYIENHVYKFKKGDMQCIRANTAHLSRSDKNSKSEWIWIFINPYSLLINDNAMISDALAKAASQGYSGVFAIEEHETLAYLINALITSESDTDEGKALQAFLAGQIILEMGKIGDKDNIGKSKEVFGKLQGALSFIRENYADSEKMTAKVIADSCGLSVSHFRYLFKKLSGMTLPQYINKTRLSSAVYMLNNTDKKITDIALSSGFNDVAYFNRLFFKEFKTTPLKMRKHFKGQ